MGNKRDEKIAKYLDMPLAVGDRIEISTEYLIGGYNCGKPTKQSLDVVKIKDGVAYCKYERSEYSFVIADSVYEKSVYHIGEKPFPENSWQKRLKSVTYGLSSILHTVGYKQNKQTGLLEETTRLMGDTDKVKWCNWNPYVQDKDGVKLYYQRPLVWSLEQKQMLIDSIYNGINCGKIIIRVRSLDFIHDMLSEGDEEISYYDIIDGKQRLNAIIDFCQDKFQDVYGNYWSDLSESQQHTFLETQLISYAEFEEKITDAEILQAFLATNFTGVPQSQEHIDYVN